MKLWNNNIYGSISWALKRKVTTKILRTSFLVLIILILGIATVVALDSDKANALDESDCLSCHSDPMLAKPIVGGGSIPLYVDGDEQSASAHRYIDCTTCHTTEPHSVETPLTKASLAEKCGSCHQYQYKLHLDSVHGEQLALGNPDVATCVDCHSENRSPHSIIRVLEHNATAYKKNIAATCAVCHGDGELMASYDITEKVYESYMRDFHGKAMELGGTELSQLNKATCTNCHGAHNIKSVNSEDSPVGTLEHLAATCEGCHEGAGEEFASGFLGHKQTSASTVPVAYYVEKFFIIMVWVIGVIAIGLVALAAIRYASQHRWKE
ncbi:MAG: hypothetical protein HN929_03990 [Chloroflexi bacterium]|jgi:hypothetical protein|nr:hypothetical protein [Chloroflexota bacterium]MBT7080616.1 hypothetical protein [Chloroflexota bacterium]MBT7289828.1 hypothetical protein [Chloroflexota bacterium]